MEEIKVNNERFFSEQYQCPEIEKKKTNNAIQIIWVDDDATFLEMGKMLLEKSGIISVTTTTRVNDVLVLLSLGSYHALITDLDMPGYHGRDLIIHIRDNGSNIPIFVVSGSEDIKEIEFLTQHYQVQSYKKDSNIIQILQEISRTLIWDLSEIAINPDFHGMIPQKSALFEMQKKDNLLQSVLFHDLMNLLTIHALNLESMMDHYKYSDEVFLELSDMHVLLEKIIKTVQEIRDINTNSVCPFWQSVESIIDGVKSNFLLSPLIIQSTINGIEIFADTLIQRVFNNLIQNSLLHGKATTIRISAFHDKDNLKIRYEDDGVGIDLDEKERIFLPKIGKNSGMGLYYVRSILALNNMTIEETRPAGLTGAQFDITIPLKKYRSNP
ncbi:MAG: sensor protein RstB [Euryarchaeota archaeon ADurb.Bin294]|jgi:CheY-like chemotaxis protein|nr:MAG: sensor protein RstB [Euryarchaeota archaeon ADurb.Bin294]